MLPDKVKELFDYPVPAHSLRAGYALGGMSLGVFFLLFLSGALLAYFGYTPDVKGAYDSIVSIGKTPLLSNFRAIHALSAELFLALAAIHVTRIVLTKSYYKERRVTWNVGIVILGLAVAFFFTGTLLKWDQEGTEAFAHVLWVNESIPGGGFLTNLLFNENIPLKMFVIHAVALPFVMAGLLGVHLVLIKALKISGLSPSAPPAPETASFTDHMKVVLTYSAIITAGVIVVSLFYQPDITGSPIDGVEWTKPPWPFLFLYTLENWYGIWPLLLGPPILFGWLLVIPSLSNSSSNWDMGQYLYFAMVALIIILILVGAWSAPVVHIM